MRTALLVEYAKPLEVHDLPVPDPGPAEVLVRVAGCGLCHSDLHLSSGEIPMLPSLPWTLGHEITGYVEAYGPGVSDGERFDHGTPVAVFGGWGCGSCAVCRAGEEQLCDTTRWAGIGAPGGYAEFVRVPAARHLLPLGPLEPVSSAPLTDAALTPYRAVKKALPRLVPGSTAVVIGAGGLGQFAVQELRELTASRIVVIEPDVIRAKRALELGADLALAPEEVDDALRGTASAVLDMVGSDASLAHAGHLVGRQGLVVVIGIAGGALPFGFLSLAPEAEVVTSYWGNRGELAEVLALAVRGALTTTVHEVDLSGAEHAMRELSAGRVEGRVVLVP